VSSVLFLLLHSLIFNLKRCYQENSGGVSPFMVPKNPMIFERDPFLGSENLKRAAEKLPINYKTFQF